MATYGAVGRRCVDNGYVAIPIMPRDKVPGYLAADGTPTRLMGWQSFATEPLPDMLVEGWSKLNAGVGIVCGDAVAIDIDIVEPELAATLELHVRRITGAKPPVRYGNAPKRLMLFRGRVENFSRKWKVGVVERGFDLLTGSRQFVAYGIHQKTGRPYHWDEDQGPADVPFDELPEITQEHVDALIKVLISEAGMPPIAVGPSANTGLTDQGSDEALIYYVERMPNPEGWGWNEWNKFVGAIYNATGGSGLGYQLARDWSSRNSKHADRQFDEKWHSYSSSPMLHVGFGHVVNVSKQLGVPPPPSSVRFRKEEPILSPLDPSFYVQQAYMLAATPQQPATFQSFTPVQTADDWIAALREEREEIEAGISDNVVSYGGLSVRMTPVNKPTPPRESTIAPPGLIAEFADWYLKTAPSRIPEYAVMSGVALVSTMLGRIVKSASGVRPSIFALLIGQSTIGKNHGRDLISRLLSETNTFSQHDLGSNVTSGAALRNAFARAAGTEPNDKGERDSEPDGSSMSKLLMSDEFGKFWTQHNGKQQNGNSASLMGDLMSIYSAAGTRWSGTAKAGEAAQAIPYPALTILGMTTPGALFEQLSEEVLRQGHVNRFLVCEAHNIEHRSFDDTAAFFRGEKLPMDTPSGVLTTFYALRQWAARQSLSHDPWIDYAQVVKVTDEASRFLASIRYLEIACQQHAQTHKSVVPETFGRMGENTVRLAMICAASRITEQLKPIDGVLVPMLELQITANDVRWAFELVRYSSERFAHCIVKELGNGQNKTADRVLQLIQERREEGAVRSALMQQTGYTKPVFDNIVATLADRGSIVAVPRKPKGPGRTAIVYFATEFAAQAAEVGSIETTGQVVQATPRAQRKRKQQPGGSSSAPPSGPASAQRVAACHPAERRDPSAA